MAPRKRFQFRVTSKNIKDATQKDSRMCMVANTILANGGSSVIVNSGVARFNIGGFRYQFGMPAAAARAIARFDDGEDVKPFTLYLSVGGSLGPVKVLGPRKKPYRKRGTGAWALRARSRGYKYTRARYHGIAIPKEA